MGFALAPLLAGHAVAQQPLSAIEWLNDPAAQQADLPEGYRLHDDIADSGAVETIEITELGGNTATGVGMLPLHVAGLPATVWSGADPDDIERRLAGLPLGLLPTANDILDRLLLAQAPSSDEILLIRLNRLFDAAKINHAFHLMQQQPITNPELFRSFFDVALLADQDGVACNQWSKNKALSDDPAINIYCRAILGDWDTAVMNYFTLSTLGDLRPIDDDLLRGFLDPELVDELNLPTAYLQLITPLEFRLRDSIGWPVPTTGLSAPFAYADLQPIAGWHAQLVAAERLAIIGSIPPATFKEIYTARVPAASGGVWDRVAAFQVTMAAAQTQNTAQLDKILGPLWAASKQAGLAPIMAKILAPVLKGQALNGSAAAAQGEISMLTLPDDAALQAAVLDLPQAQRAAVADAFARPMPIVPPAGGITAPDVLAALAHSDNVNEGNTARLPDMITSLRAMGMESDARAMVVEYMLLVHTP